MRGDLSLRAGSSAAEAQVAVCVPDYAPFAVELAGVEIFPLTQVIYLELARGATHLRTLHDSLNSRSLEFDEPYEYHPHVTLAQGLSGIDVLEAHELAQSRWREFQSSRSFRAETLTFVQNTESNRWIALVQYELGTMASVSK